MEGKQLRKCATSNSVINLVPPREIWPSIQSIRTLTTPEARCGPHMSFIDPFIVPEQLHLAATILEKKLQQVEPFTVTLEKFNFFQHQSSCTLYLEPTITPPNGLNLLQEAIMNAFPQCNDTVKRGNGTFVPHISLGRYKTKNDMLKARRSFESKWKPLTFQIKEIYLLYRPGIDPFEVKHVIHLGTNPTKAYFGPNTADDDSQVAKTVVVAGLPKSVLKTDADLLKLVQNAGLSPQKVELTFNPDGKARPLGVLEFSSKDEAMMAVESYSHQPFNGSVVYLRPLEVMFFPDVIGGCCTLKNFKIV